MPAVAQQVQGGPLAVPWAFVEDVAGHLGVARDSVYRWIEGKGLPAHRLGKLWKFKLSEVDGWIRGGGANEAATAAKALRKGKPGKKR